MDIKVYCKNCLNLSKKIKWLTVQEGYMCHVPHISKLKFITVTKDTWYGTKKVKKLDGIQDNYDPTGMNQNNDCKMYVKKGWKVWIR